MPFFLSSQVHFSYLKLKSGIPTQSFRKLPCDGCGKDGRPKKNPSSLLKGPFFRVPWSGASPAPRVSEKDRGRGTLPGLAQPMAAPRVPAQTFRPPAPAVNASFSGCGSPRPAGVAAPPAAVLLGCEWCGARGALPVTHESAPSELGRWSWAGGDGPDRRGRPAPDATLPSPDPALPSRDSRDHHRCQLAPGSRVSPGLWFVPLSPLQASIFPRLEQLYFYFSLLSDYSLSHHPFPGRPKLGVRVLIGPPINWSAIGRPSSLQIVILDSPAQLSESTFRRTQRGKAGVPHFTTWDLGTAVSTWPETTARLSSVFLSSPSDLSVHSSFSQNPYPFLKTRVEA